MPEQARSALVTGAASGIGQAIARRLVSSGHSVVLVDVHADRLAAVGAELGQPTLVLDIADAASIERGIASITTDHGIDVLDVLVNAAGIADAGPTTELDVASYRRVLAVNLDGMVALTLGLLPLLRASSAGRVLNIGSVQGLASAADTLAYATSKGGVHAFTRSLAVDLASDGVLVNALAPGFVDTPMARFPDGSSEYDTEWFRDVYITHGRLPLRRPAEADEVAAVAEFFVSPLNTYVTGQVIAVDGGLGATF
jgi:3-oxoacyl-[acyl-carrier protein] reductase